MSAKKSRDNATFLPKYILQESTPFSVQEAYKSLRTNLTYSLPGEHKCMIFGVTSSNRAEGKSTSALNLALSYAAIGKRVLLIDCDLRCPSIAAKLRSRDIKGTPGLSDILVGKVRLQACVRPLADTTLDVLPSGTIPPDATSLLESEGMTSLFESVKQHYEIVIVDLPPVLSVVDASILARHLDGLLLVVRHNSTRFDAVNESIRQLRLVDAKILGFLYNDTPLEEKKYGRYGKYGKYGSYGTRHYYAAPYAQQE